MKREFLKESLAEYGYKHDTIKSLLCGRAIPPAKKMFEIEEKFNIPVHAWKDIKSFISNSNSNNKISNKTTIKAS